MEYKYKFTVFTPSYNRAGLLDRLYNSLKEQTFKDFEWLIVDDGSTDNTEEIVRSYQDEGVLNIRYIKKENGGKHTAVKKGVEEAQGELFLMIDSDDYFTPYGIEGFNEEWEKIEDKENYSSVCCVCKDTKGRIIGTKFPKDVIDSNSMEIREKYGVLGDKAAFTRTDVYREYPFPVFKGERFITEAVVDDLVAMKYKTRFVNKIFCVKEYQEGGLSDNSLKLRVNNPKGTIYYYNQSMEISESYKKRMRSAINYMRFCYHAGMGTGEAVSGAKNKGMAMVAAAPAWTMYLKDKKEL